LDSAWSEGKSRPHVSLREAWATPTPIIPRRASSNSGTITRRRGFAGKREKMNEIETNNEPSKHYRRAIKRYPELHLFENDESRKKALGLARSLFTKSPAFWVRYFGYGLLGITFVAVFLRVFRVFEGVPSLPRFVRGLPIVLIEVWLLDIITMYLTKNTIRHSLRLQLQEIGIPVCLNCGYDLRGQVEPRCSECGRAFDPALLHREIPRQLSDASSPPPTGA
jgi:hypothetical protein